MDQTQHDFLQLAHRMNALSFGEFTLKSGRISPYFFNMGDLCTGEALSVVGDAYAAAIVESGVPEIDTVFGPAYKGIPLATAAALSLDIMQGRNVSFCYNRKEEKDHGEGGKVVGEMGEHVFIVDDVITKGTAIREAIDIIRGAGGTPVGIVVAVDRQERGQGELSAVQEVEQQFGIPVFPIVTLDDIMEYASGMESGLAQYIDQMAEYRAQYGVAA